MICCFQSKICGVIYDIDFNSLGFIIVLNLSNRLLNQFRNRNCVGIRLFFDLHQNGRILIISGYFLYIFLSIENSCNIRQTNLCPVFVGNHKVIHFLDVSIFPRKSDCRTRSSGLQSSGWEI